MLCELLSVFFDTQAVSLSDCGEGGVKIEKLAAVEDQQGRVVM